MDLNYFNLPPDTDPIRAVFVTLGMCIVIGVIGYLTDPEVRMDRRRRRLERKALSNRETLPPRGPER